MSYTNPQENLIDGSLKVPTDEDYGLPWGKNCLGCGKIINAQEKARYVAIQQRRKLPPGQWHNECWEKGDWSVDYDQNVFNSNMYGDFGAYWSDINRWKRAIFGIGYNK